LDEAARRGDGVKLETKPYESVSGARRRLVVAARRKTHTPLVVIDSSQARQSMVSI
jgi:hypothetical protein